MEQLHPGAKWLFRVKGYTGAIFFLIFISWFFIPFLVVLAKVALGITTTTTIVTALIILILYIIAIIIIAEIYARMAYNRWFYEFTKDNLKIERGIIWKRYSNVPYERVQNVDIRRGIIARIIGFSSVMIQTAGYSGQPSAEGYIPAVTPEAAEKIREFLMKKISKRGRNQGL
jgi:membrane protein YdbS with pleckstrin-like domain